MRNFQFLPISFYKFIGLINASLERNILPDNF